MVYRRHISVHGMGFSLDVESLKQTLRNERSHVAHYGRRSLLDRRSNLRQQDPRLCTRHCWLPWTMACLCALGRCVWESPRHPLLRYARQVCARSVHVHVICAGWYAWVSVLVRLLTNRCPCAQPFATFISTTSSSLHSGLFHQPLCNYGMVSRAMRCPSGPPPGLPSACVWRRLCNEIMATFVRPNHRKQFPIMLGSGEDASIQAVCRELHE